MVCFNDHCPRHEQCLRWQVGHHVAPSQHVVTCINPHYAPVAEGRCDHFRDARAVTMHVGMKSRFYRDMPAHIARGIRDTLIAHNCRATYYHYHNGHRPIPPKYEAFIRRTCIQHGWTQPLHFDEEMEDYVW